MARLELDLDPEDVRVLRGALLAAKATELADSRRRDTRLSLGYGTDAARDGMSAEMAHHDRRIELLDRLLAALQVSTGPVPPGTVEQP